MKAVMYHYVREYNPQLPFFTFLDFKNFQEQLDYFNSEYGFVSKEDWVQALNEKSLGSAKGKILLTFDDAVSCHYDYVFPELLKRGLWGIFYVPTQPYQKSKILDVHRIHLLCGAFEGIKLISTLKELLDESMIPDKKIREFREQTYTRQENFEGVSEFKRILNYYISYEYREALIDSIAADLGFEFNVSDFYISIDKLKEMQLGGNIIGSHTVSHPVMSKLSDTEQRSEISDSFNFLSGIGYESIKTYCHPYGGFQSFNDETVAALNLNNVDFSFNVEPRDICNNDFLSSIQFLPRYDCNQFPFGNATKTR